jgi:hypothetical protein
MDPRDLSLASVDRLPKARTVRAESAFPSSLKRDMAPRTGVRVYVAIMPGRAAANGRFTDG